MFGFQLTDKLADSGWYGAMLLEAHSVLAVPHAAWWRHDKVLPS
jgi:hypothetical protein